MLIVRSLLIVGVLLGICMPLLPAYAQLEPLLPKCDPVPGNQPNQVGEDCAPKHLFELAINVYNLLLYFAGMVAIILIILGGIRMFTYSFMEKPEAELESAKLMVTRAVTGLVIVLAAFLIVNTLVFFLSGQGLNVFLNKRFGL